MTTKWTSLTVREQRAVLELIAATEERVRGRILADPNWGTVAPREETVALAMRAMQARIARGWTKERTAAEAGVPLPVVEAVEDGNWRPTIGTVERLAGALGIEADVLLGVGS